MYTLTACLDVPCGHGFSGDSECNIEPKMSISISLGCFKILDGMSGMAVLPHTPLFPSILGKNLLFVRPEHAWDWCRWRICERLSTVRDVEMDLSVNTCAPRG